MMKRYFILGIVSVLLLSGIFFAISGADNVHISDSTSHSRYTSDTMTSYTTEGGNITNSNLTVTYLTDKWALFYGNITGNLSLSSNVSGTLYNALLWTWDSTHGGEICFSTGDVFSWNDANSTVNANNIDNLWNFSTTDPDSANKTFNDSCTNTLSFFSGAVNVSSPTCSIHSNHGSDYSNFTTYAVDDNGLTDKSDIAFCTLINGSNNDYQGSKSAYEVVVPTPAKDGETETYYVYVELD